MMQRREAPLSIKFSNLEPGDVLLFLPSKEICRIQHVIMWLQWSLCLSQTEKGGHYDTTHAAICGGHDEQNRPLLIHIGPDGYSKETIQHYDTEDRAFMIFRHLDKARRQKIVEIANDEQNKKLKWKLMAALKALFRLPRLNENRKTRSDIEKELTEWTFCSKFTIECMKKAARLQGDRENITSSACPQSLESYLYYNPNYQMYVYTGISAFKTLKAEIEKEIEHKGQAIKEKYDALINRIKNEMHGRNVMHKILVLLNEMLPLLKPFSSCTTLYTIARRHGIFIDRDVLGYPTEEIFSPHRKKLTSSN